MKQIIRKPQVYHDNFPNSLRTNKTSITDKNAIPAKFSEFFVNAGSNLIAKKPPSDKHFASYLPNISTIFPEKFLAEKNLSVFFSLKTNKTPSYVSKNVNIIKKIYRKIKTTLINIFNLLFLDKLEIVGVS